MNAADCLLYVKTATWFTASLASGPWDGFMTKEKLVFRILHQCHTIGTTKGVIAIPKADCLLTKQDSTFEQALQKELRHVKMHDF